MSVLGSRMLFGLALAFVLLASSVNAHGWMTNPAPRGQFKTPPNPGWIEYMAATTDPMDPMITCRNDTAAPRANWIKLTAGTTQSISLEFNAKHVGDCFVYLSYDGDKPEDQMKWFKIWQQHSCKDSNMYNIPIPAYLPSGDHVVFRWEWYALHKYPTVEYYASCADATMTGTANGVLPTPQVNIPGHLPYLTGSFQVSPATNTYWWPFDQQAMFFTGPAVATINGQNPTSAPPTAPTQKPVTPTSAPVTSAPVTSAPVTSAPVTSAPVTSAPVTSAPVTSAPVTSAPVTPKPTNPTSCSLKLNVMAGSGAWWFVVTVSGCRSNEIAKMEIKDGGLFGSSFSLMDKSWIDASLGQVWVFNPASKGALTLPITVKASVASGSSISFTSNKFASTLVDSGVSF